MSGFARVAALWLALAAGTAAAAPPPAAGPSFDAQFRAARALAAAGRRAEALAAYTALLQRSPGNSDVLLGRGRVYAWEHRWAEAEADLGAVVVRSPQYADAWSALGDLYLWSGRPPAAAEAYGRWIALAPADPAAYLARGRAYRAAGRLEAARADFDAAAARGADCELVNDALRSLERRARDPETFVPEGYAWQLQFGASQTEFSPARADWFDYALSLRHYRDAWSLAGEWLSADRFGQADDAWALDAYVDLWRRAYANLRVQHGPDGALYPETAWRAELFQGVGAGWELSAGIDQLRFRASTADLYGLGIGKYAGNWYLRWKHLFTHSDSSSGNSDQGLVRWYYAGNGDDYLEARASLGRSTQDLDGRPGAGAPRDSRSIGLALASFPHRHWGYKIGTGYGDDDDSFVARQVSATLYLRW